MFPHATFTVCGHQIAAAVHACLDSGARRVLALGVLPGPRVGEILKAVYERQLDGEVTTVEDAIAAAKHFAPG